MWDRNYQDYPKDKLMGEEKHEAGKGVIGCEMKERFGWGHTHEEPPPSGGILSSIASLFCGSGEKK